MLSSPVLKGRRCPGRVRVAWVQRGESVIDTLDWLCTVNLGLLGWEATFATSMVWQPSDDAEVMQIAFDITIAADSEPAWPGSHQWWHTHTEPPPMHYIARPVLEPLFGVQPEG